MISGAEFWIKDAVLMKQNRVFFFFALKEQRKPCYILKVWIEAEHCDVFDTQHCKMKEPRVV